MNFWFKAVAVPLIFGCLAAGIPVQAQPNNCGNVRLLLQAKLDFTGLPPRIGWFGTVRGFFNDKYPLIGELYYVGDGTLPGLTTSGQAAHEWGRFALDFTKNSPKTGVALTVADKGVFHLLPGVSPHMTYEPVPPAQAFGLYAATVDVAPGSATVLPLFSVQSSGAFSNAIGKLSMSGYFLVNAPFPADMGIWNAEINGRLCNVDATKLPTPLTN